MKEKNKSLSDNAYLSSVVKRPTRDKSLEANIKLVLNNARLAAEVAREM